MSDPEFQSPIHWRYMLGLEQDLLETSDYVEFTKFNYECFSVEFAKVLLGAGSEVDVVAKQLSRMVDPKAKAENINHYMSILRPAYPRLESMEVMIPRFGLKLQPWSNWQKITTPDWWTAYNNVKHHRHTKFKDANLKNALYSVAGLFVMVLYFYHDLAEDGRLSPNPVLLRPAESYQDGATVWETELLIAFRLSA